MPYVYKRRSRGSGAGRSGGGAGPVYGDRPEGMRGPRPVDSKVTIKWAAAAILALMAASVAIGATSGLWLSSTDYLTKMRDVRDSAMAWVDRSVLKKPPTKQAHGHEPLGTALHQAEYAKFSLVPFPERAAAFVQLPGERFLVSDAHGTFLDFSGDGRIAPAEIPAPINLAEIEASPFWKAPNFNQLWFRVNDLLMLPKEGAAGTYDLWATHHWFHADRGCITVRFSHLDIAVSDGAIKAQGPWRTLMETAPCVDILLEKREAFGGHLSGGKMMDWDAERLMVTMGEQTLFESRGMNLSQNPETPLGKILLINKTTGAWEVFANGSRNAQGLVRAADGRIWSTEHGPKGGDELNLVQKGDNLGFPYATLGVNYDYRPWPGRTREGSHEGYQTPRHAWVPSVGISAVVQMKGPEFPNWEDDLIVGALGGRALMRLRLDGDDVVYEERISLPGYGIRDLEVLPDGRLVALTNRMEILIIRNQLGPGGFLEFNMADSLGVPPDALKKPVSPERLAAITAGAETFAATCTHCHTLSGVHGSGPHLNDIVGRQIARVDGFEFTPALKAKNERWTEKKIADYLLDPETFAQGTAMGPMGLDRATADAVAAFLAEPYRAPAQKPHGGEQVGAAPTATATVAPAPKGAPAAPMAPAPITAATAVAAEAPAAPKPAIRAGPLRPSAPAGKPAEADGA